LVGNNVWCGTISRPNLPPGCIYKNIAGGNAGLGGDVYFNTHSASHAHPDAWPICSLPCTMVTDKETCSAFGCHWIAGECHKTKLSTVSPSTGVCPEGKALTEAQCRGVSGQGADGSTVKFASAGTWGSGSDPESCGCYFDGNGLVYFNRRTYNCSQADDDESNICRK
jgi:hypothetical protein